MLLSGGAVAAFFLWHGPAALFAGNEDAPAAESAMDGTAAPPLQPGVQQTAAQNAKWFTYSMHGAWKVRCHGQVGPDSCIGLIDLTDSHKRRLVVWAIGRNTKGSFVSNIQVPSGVQLDQGLSIRFAGKNEPPDARRLAFSNCEPAGCVTKVLMDNDFLGQARMASRADLTAVSSEGKAITFHVPVAGLDEVLNDL